MNEACQVSLQTSLVSCLVRKDIAMIKIDIEEFDRLVSDARESGTDCYSKIVEHLVHATNAKAGAFWNCSQTPYIPLAHCSQSEATKVSFSQADHEHILDRIVKQNRSAIVSTRAVGNAEPLTLFVSPLQSGQRIVVELVFGHDHSIRTSREFVQDLNRLCDKLKQLPAVEAVESAGAQREPGGTKDIPAKSLSGYTHALHTSIERDLTLANVVNETRRLLDCDRVSVLERRGNKFKITAISGQPSVNRRSNTVQLLERLANETLKAKTDLWYPSTANFTPQIKSALDQYLVTSASRSLIIQPILASPASAAEADGERAAKEYVIAGIIYEHCRVVWHRDHMESTIQLTTQHSGDALRNARQHQQLFLYPLWHWLGKSKLLTASELLPKSLMLALTCVLVGLFLALWPAQFYVSATGVLVPQHRRLVFAKTSGEVIEVAVEHGQSVKQSEKLVILRNEDLKLRMQDVQGRLETLKQRRSAMEQTKFKSSSATSSSPGTSEENLKSLQAEIDSLQRQADGLEQIQSDLQVVSPMDGQVISWDVKQKLFGRTITPSNVLMEIADTAGPWQLELDVEDRHIEDVFRGALATKDGKLQVQFTLAASPNRTFHGTVSEISRAVQLNRDNQQMMRLKVDIDEQDLDFKQSRTSAVAKIYTGETTSLGYLWLHEVPRVLNRYFFFYFVR